MPVENKKRLVKLLNQKQVALIEDDIHGDLNFGTRRPTTLKSYDGNDRVLYCSSLSKTLAPGLRKGGFALWVELNPKVDSLEVYREAQRHRISILPGIMCSTTPKFNHFIRLSYGFPWSEALEKGVRTLGQIVHKFC